MKAQKVIHLLKWYFHSLKSKEVMDLFQEERFKKELA